MKAKDTSYLIDITKHAPTELAKQEVLSFITTIPTLPPPSTNWFQNFNLNSIIMTTTAIALVTSAVIYFSSPTERTEVQRIDPSTANSPSLLLDSLEIVPNIQFHRIEIDTVREEIVEVKTTTTIGLTPEAEDRSKPQDQGISAKKETNVTPLTTAQASTNNRNRTRRFFEVTPEEEVEISAQVRLSPSELRSLKRQLLKLLKEDNIDESGIASFSALWYTADYLQLNDIKLEGEMLRRYKTVLDKFSITPGPDRRVVVNNDFIQVGDFTDKGFDGQAIGKKMEIYFIEGDEKGLFSKEASKKPGIFEESDDDVILKTMGEFKHAKVNLSKVDRILSDRSTSPPKDGNRFYDSGKEALSIYTKRTEDIFVELNGKQLRSLKKELYKELMRHQLINNRKEDVRFLFEADDILVNGTKLTEQMTFSYQRLLETYGIKAAESRKILMCTDFIVIGDFKVDNFSGSLLGSLNSQDIRKSIFRQDFKDFPVFGFDKAMKNK